MDRGNLLHHIRDLIGIGNDDLLCLLPPQIGKLRQHLLCGPKVERRLVICIVKAFSCHDDPAVNLVFRIQEMHVTGGYYRLIKCLTQFYNFFVDLLEIFLCIDIRPVWVPEHKSIVSYGLDLQIIIEIHQPGDFRLRSAV